MLQNRNAPNGSTLWIRSVKKELCASVKVAGNLSAIFPIVRETTIDPLAIR